MAVMSGMPDRADADRPEAGVLPVPEELSDLLPQKGIARGTIVGCTGARSLLTALIAAATRAGCQVGIVGLPRLNLLAAAEMGADLDRIAVVTDPGIDPVEVAAVLLDGMDLVVLGLRGVTVPRSRCATVSGRVRRQSSSLLVVDGTWPGAQTQLSAQVLGYRHRPRTGDADLTTAASGHGRVAGMRLQVTAEGGGRRRRTVEIDLIAPEFGEENRLRMLRLDSIGARRAIPVGAIADTDDDVAVAN
ncbi:hypothetical protein [Gordonia sp. NPDC003376]